MRRYFELTLCVAAVSVLASCGSGTSVIPQPNNTPPEFLYAIVNAGSLSSPQFGLQTFQFDPSTKTITSSSNILNSTEGFAGLAVDPGGKFLYASDGSPTVQRYSIDQSTGELHPLSSFIIPTQICPCPVTSNPGALAFSSSGRFLYYGSSSAGAVTQVVGALAVDNAGALSQVTGSPFLADHVPVSLALQPAGNFVLTENTTFGFLPLPLDSVSVFAVDPNTGALSEATGSPLILSGNETAAGLNVHPSGRFVYASTGAASNGVLGWSLNQTTGALQPLEGSPFLPTHAAFGGSFNPTGTFFYVSGALSSGILGFSVDLNSGTLTPLPNSPFANGSTLLGPIVDPSGKFLFAVDTLNKQLLAFSIDNAGNLSAAASTPVGIPFFQLTIVGR